jgi:hypothetical protein
MRAARAVAGALLGFMTSVLVFEAVLRLLPVSVGLYRESDEQTWPLRGYVPHKPFTYSNGWEMLMQHHASTNNYGQIAPFDFEKGSRPVIVLGDSFVEGQMLEYSDTLQAQIQEFAGTKPSVYGFGFSGNSLAEYLATASLARSEFAPRAAVLVLIDGDVAESVLDRPGHYAFTVTDGHAVLGYRPRPARSRLSEFRAVIGESSLYRYVFGNLSFTISDLFARPVVGTPKHANITVKSAALTSLERSAIETFLAEFPARSGIAAHCTVLLLDADRYALYPGGSRRVRKDNQETVEYLTERARAAGFRVIDLGPRFAKQYYADGQKLDFWPVDPHWNRAGHRVAAEAAVEALNVVGSDGASCL